MNSPPKVLIGCERSGVLRNAFRTLGIDAYSCDLEGADDASPYHLQCDVFHALTVFKWALVIIHPPCTYLSVSGLHWNHRRPGRDALTREAVALVAMLLDWAQQTGVPMILENPVGCINTCIPSAPKPQYIQPYMFGDDASKKTGLWYVGCEPIVIPERKLWYPPRRVMHDGKMRDRWGNQTDSGQNKLPPSADRAKIRSETYPGIATGLASQLAPRYF